MSNLLLSHLVYAIPIIIGLLGLFILFKSVAIAGSKEVIVLERKYFGKKMMDGRTIALQGEVGIQARLLGPGTHWVLPFVTKIHKYPLTVIKNDEIGVISSITGKPVPSGQYLAEPVACNLYLDGEAFLKNGGQKGQQCDILPPGEYQINPMLFQVVAQKSLDVKDDEVAIIEALAGSQCPIGRIWAQPIECDNYQNATAFLKNGGQKGPQIKILGQGKYRINPNLFKWVVKPVTVIEGGKIGLVSAMDGGRIPDGRLLGKKTEEHINFQDGEAFLKNGGEKGRQLETLMPGTYRINTDLFTILQKADWTSIGPDDIGIVTVLEGKPIADQTQIAATSVDLTKHSNFQDASAFISNGGEKGLQIPVLKAGNYAINPWFATIAQVPMTKVDIGFCGVVTSYVGAEGTDQTKDDVNAKIVENGKKGIWVEPLQPGKHPINTKICKVDIVPTTQILLSWADSRTSAHKLDENLKTITLRTADAFSVNMDVNVIVHIQMKNAPMVIANLGSVANMISQVLEPAISSHFRNAAQYIQALDLYTKRKELQEKAKEHIANVLKEHHIDSRDTLIADVVLPLELTKPVTDRQIAEQEKTTFTTQRAAQIERRELENAKAQAEMQPEVVKSERNVEIQKNIADGKIKEAEGAKASAVLFAEGSAEAVKIKAIAEAEATKVTADAIATKTTKEGTAEADIILAKGKATAEANKLQVDAMGQDGFVSLQKIDKLSNLKLKLIPDNLILGGGGGNEGGTGYLNNFMGISLLEKLGVNLNGHKKEASN